MFVVCLWWLARTTTASAGDPWLRWYTLRTPHFRVHYHSGLEKSAQRIAGLAEHVHATLTPHLSWAPTAPVEVVLTDESDSANGFATAVPYNSIRLYATAPDEMSPLSDHDDWQLELFTHEYTHILHTDNISGLPALVNAVIGKNFAPNQRQPRWILEGLAVAMESQRTSGGRLKSSLFDMYLRADVLEDNLATLDQLNHSPRRWPGGELWYLYGAKFIEWILDTYGPDTYAAVARDYGANLIPWGINRSIRRVTGRTYPELYTGWKATLTQRYGAQAAAVRARGLREGRRLTFGGRILTGPRFVPSGCARQRDADIVYFRDDGHSRAGWYRQRVLTDKPTDPELITRAFGAVGSFAPDCALYFDSLAPTRRRYNFSDLFRLGSSADDPSGESLERARLTTGQRAREPDVSPDGRHVAYVTNAAGTSTLRIAELSEDGALRNPRRLVPSARYEQAYTPRFSPDGRFVAYSAWTRGGYRDIRLVDVQSGAVTELFHDRAIDQQPSFSPDGKTLYFSSDRSGVSNIYAYDLATLELEQVTNVINGAFSPQVSPDGRTLAYVGYTSRGFDLFLLPLNRANWLPAPQPVTREDAPPVLTPRRFPVEPYSALPTLRPRALWLEVGTSIYGTALTASTSGQDAVGLHAIAAQATAELSRPEWRASVDYTYSRLPFDLRLSAFRGSLPRGEYRIGEQRERVIERNFGVTSGLGLNLPGEFDGQAAAFSFTVARFEHDAPVGTRPDPGAEIPVEPASGTIAAAHLGYAFTNVELTQYSISPERGVQAFISADFADPAFGSTDTWSAVYGGVLGYVPLPWLRHHVLALSATGGSAGGSYPRRGAFSVGGFNNQPVLDVYTSGLRQSPFVLRGFLPGQFVGANYNLFNAEYRFPIAYVDRGISTLPVFLHHLSGAFFADWGGAYDRIDREHPLRVMHLGIGAELWLELRLGYSALGTLRLGAARGFGEQAPNALQTYFVAASAF